MTRDTCIHCPRGKPVWVKKWKACSTCYLKLFVRTRKVKPMRSPKHAPARPPSEPLYLCVAESKSAKLRGMAITYSPRATCPTSCPLRANGCYAEVGNVGLQWRRCESGESGRPWAEHLQELERLDAPRVRLNVAGDLPGAGDEIDPARLRLLAAAATAGARQAWTYTHKPAGPANLGAMRAAAALGLVVNLSADTLEDADALAETGLPVTVVVGVDAPKDLRTPAGRRVLICPAQLDQGERITCGNCGGAGTALCARQERDFVVGFRAHGSARRKAEFVASGRRLPVVHLSNRIPARGGARG
jgi:hypothetical protein